MDDVVSDVDTGREADPRAKCLIPDPAKVTGPTRTAFDGDLLHGFPVLSYHEGGIAPGVVGLRGALCLVVPGKVSAVTAGLRRDNGAIVSVGRSVSFSGYDGRRDL